VAIRCKCESCVQLTFLKEATILCPACSTTLKRNSFVLLSTDDSGLEKENTIRKRILKIYNKRREDYPSLREYNDYIEAVEDISIPILSLSPVYVQVLSFTLKFSIW